MSTSSVTHRPVTSKARGVCRYYTDHRGCFAGDKCKFLHADPALVEQEQSQSPILTPYDKSKKCRYFANGFCRRGDKCWFLHIDAESVQKVEEDDSCSICFEKPVTFGLLAGCSHVFCITCIKQWRDPAGKSGDVVESGNTKKCPMCRAPSKFITPSSKFFKHGDEEKTRIIQAYKESMGRVPCRYFQQSRRKNKDKPFCPFGKDCFYQHLNIDGTPYVFKDGVDVCMRQHRARLEPDEMRIPFFPFAFLGAGMSEPSIIPFMQRARDGEGSDSQAEGPETTPSMRFREFNRTMDLLNDILRDESSPDGLTAAMETLRLGFRRNANAEVLESLNSLNSLANQMLVSFSAIQSQQEADRSDTPPPPLEPMNTATTLPSLPSTFLESDSIAVVTGVSRYSYSGSEDDTLPGLQSVSNSSDSEQSDYEESDDNESLQDGDIHVSRVHNAELFDTWGDRAARRIEQQEALIEDITQHAADDSDNMPSLEPMGARGNANSFDDAPAAETPFVTNGHGRVVWRTCSEPVSLSPSDENLAGVAGPSMGNGIARSRSVGDGVGGGEFTTDGRGRVVNVGRSEEDSAVEGGSGEGDGDGRRRSFIGRMLDALF